MALHHLPDARPKLVEFISSTLRIVEPKLLNVAEEDRVQYGRYALGIATEVRTPRKYGEFSLLISESVRVIKMREAA